MREKRPGRGLWLTLAGYLALLVYADWQASALFPTHARWLLLVLIGCKIAVACLVASQLAEEHYATSWRQGAVAAFVLCGLGSTLWHWPRALEQADPGVALVQRFGCVSCHAIPGFAAPEHKLGPDLAGIAERRRVPGQSPEQYIRESIERPGAYVVPGYLNVMPELRSHMTSAEFEDLVSFLLTLRERP